MNVKLDLVRLESRDVPATLFVRGSPGADALLIRDLGGHVVEVVSRTGRAMHTDVDRVVASLGDGNDFVRLEMAGTDDMDYLFDLGRGDDRFDVVMNAMKVTPGNARSDPVEYKVRVLGGPGDDSLGAEVGFAPQPGPPIFLDLGLEFYGGPGEDILTTDLIFVNDEVFNPAHKCAVTVVHDEGLGDGITSFRAFKAIGDPTEGLRVADMKYRSDLGAGNDFAEVDVRGLDVDELSVAVGGGAGDDEVGIIIIGGRVGAMAQSVDLGAGADSALFVMRDVLVDKKLSVAVGGGGGGDEVGIIIINNRVDDPEYLVDLGAGDDRANVVMDGVAHNYHYTCDLLGGDGDDEVRVKQRDVTSEGGRMLVSTGRGDDRVFAEMQDVGQYESMTTSLLTGEGDDLVVADVEDSFLGGGLLVDTGRGDDFLSAELTDVGHSDNAAVRFLTGVGDDVVVARATQTTVPAFGMLVDFGDGDDVGDLHFVFNPAGGVNDPRPRNWSATVLGGAGHDNLTVRAEVVAATFAPPLRLDLLVDGGNGNDALNVLTTAPVVPAFLTSLEINVDVRGGVGDDFLSVFCEVSGFVDLTAVADGGSGLDGCVTTPNVTVTRCEY